MIVGGMFANIATLTFGMSKGELTLLTSFCVITACITLLILEGDMLKIFCPKHPRYTGQISPRANCDFCMEVFIIRGKAEFQRLGIGNATPKGTPRK